MLFDTHCHITSGSYNKDREDMIQRAFDAGMKYMMCPGTGRAVVCGGRLP